jgi:hypothetical protein
MSMQLRDLVLPVLSFQLFDLLSKVTMGRKNFKQPDKGSHDCDVHLHRTLAVNA